MNKGGRQMENLDSKELIEEAIKNNKMLLAYFGTMTCGVCVDLKPKVEAMLEKYPKIESIYLNIEKYPNLGIAYSFFTAPGIILFIEGKETIREARHISMDSLEDKVSRYYSMVFE